MAMNFTTLNGLVIPEGNVTKITDANGIVLWENNAIPTLERASWKFISEASKAGLASTYWSVGSSKTIYINGVAYRADIIGFDHDTPTNTITYGRSKTGITFQLHNLLTTTYKMNNSNTNTGGWKSSIMRTSTMSTLFNQLNSDLKSVIVPVNKITGVGNGASSGTEITSDKLFLLAEGEVFNENSSISFEDEYSSVTQYSYFKGMSRVTKIKDNSAHSWWLRSPESGGADVVCVINLGYALSARASSSSGVGFAFCV